MNIEQGIHKQSNNCKSNELQSSQITYIIKDDKKQVIYVQPVPSQNQDQKIIIFHPHNWNINDFQVGRRLGKGKYGYVYLARQKKTKMILALKVLQKSKMLKEQVMSHVRRQLQIHSHLNHPNILKMYGFFYDENRMYIMLEYATRGDLYCYLKKNKKLTEKTVQNYMKQMINAFIYLQSFNIIHRDIKPQNILISSNDTLKICDFGLAVKASTQNRKTFCGTLDYFSPEIINYRPFDYKVDNWGLGILAFELLTGYSPFYAKNKKQFFDNILYSSIQFPLKSSELLKDFVKRLTKKKANQRMQLSDALVHKWLNNNIEEMDIQIPGRVYSFSKNI